MIQGPGFTPFPSPQMVRSPHPFAFPCLPISRPTASPSPSCSSHSTRIFEMSLRRWRARVLSSPSSPARNHSPLNGSSLKGPPGRASVPCTGNVSPVNWCCRICSPPKSQSCQDAGPSAAMGSKPWLSAAQLLAVRRTPQARYAGSIKTSGLSHEEIRSTCGPCILLSGAQTDNCYYPL